METNIFVTNFKVFCDKRNSSPINSKLIRRCRFIFLFIWWQIYFLSGKDKLWETKIYLSPNKQKDKTSMKGLLVTKHFRLGRICFGRRKYFVTNKFSMCRVAFWLIVRRIYFRLPKHILPRQKYICRLINKKIKRAWRVYWWRNIFISHNLSFPDKKCICHQINFKLIRRCHFIFLFIWWQTYFLSRKDKLRERKIFRHQ